MVSKSESSSTVCLNEVYVDWATSLKLYTAFHFNYIQEAGRGKEMGIFDNKAEKAGGGVFEYQRRDSAGQPVYRARANITCNACSAIILRDSLFIQGDERQNFCNRCRPIKD